MKLGMLVLCASVLGAEIKPIKFKIEALAWKGQWPLRRGDRLGRGKELV